MAGYAVHGDCGPLDRPPYAAGLDDIDTLVVEVDDAEAVHARRAAGFNLRAIAAMWACRSIRWQALWRVFANGIVPFDRRHHAVCHGVRRPVYLNHPIFSQHHSTEMLRYLRRHCIGSDDRLGPALNATACDVARVYKCDPSLGQRIGIGGHAVPENAVSLQPNAGSQGEYAGLVFAATMKAGAIRAGIFV